MLLKSILKGQVLVVFLLLCLPLFAQNKEAEQYKIDSTLYIYYQRCLEFNSSPVVLSMADTLFQMSAKKNDQRMQAVALCTALDYYFYKAIEDSIIAHTERVKQFAKKTNQPKYYYFAWGNRLIHYYVKSGKTNTAFYESEKMRKEAQANDDKEGLVNCYRILSNIYELKKMERQAFECLLKEVDLIETYQLSRYNLPNSYRSISDFYLKEKNYPKALEALKKADASITSSAHEVTCNLAYMRYYLATNHPELAEARLKDAIQKINKDKKLFAYKKSVYSAEFDFSKSTRQFGRALVALDSMYNEQKKLGEDAVNLNILRNRGEIYLMTGNSKEAADYLSQYILVEDSLNAIHEQDAATEFATLLGLEKVNAEKQLLKLEAQGGHLKNTRVVIISLVSFLLAVFAFLYREHLMNKKLKNSSDLLQKKNEELIASEERLRVSKEEAEKASLMKSHFIQNMTHEIRTPLNSIVGFSQIITSMFDEQGETEEFTSIIEENTNKLLKLIDDVLELSDEESSKVLEITDTNVHKYCQQSLDRVRPYLHKGVELEYEPNNENLVVPLNGDRLSQILYHLMHNAARATLKGKIMLGYSLTRDKQSLRLTVTDTGIGIPEDKHEEVFERFSKLDDFSQGFGLGLPICRLLTEKLGGTIQIDKTYKEGCRIVLTFPAKHL